MPKIKHFCTCHGYSKGSARDKRAHKPYATRDNVTTATYEARMRVGRQWLNRQQIARQRGFVR